MEIPYFFWWLEYVMNLSEKDAKIELLSVPEKFMNYRKEVPSFSGTEEVLNEIDLHFNLIGDYLDRYEETEDNTYLSEIQRVTGRMNDLTGDFYYGDLEFFLEFLPLKKEAFLEKQAEKEVVNSTPLKEIENMIDLLEKDEISEEEMWDYLDVLRDVIYDIQDSDLADLLEEESRSYKNSQDETIELSPFIDIFETSVNNLEDSLEAMERAFQKKDLKEGRSVLKRVKKDLKKLKAIEIMSEMGGGGN